MHQFSVGEVNEDHSRKVDSKILGNFQVEGSQEVTAITGAVPSLDQREELYDPLATPDVDKLNSFSLNLFLSGEFNLFLTN